MAIIEFDPENDKKKEIADYLIRQELEGFREAFDAFAEYCQLTYLFDEIDFTGMYNNIMEKAKENRFRHDGTLKMPHVQNIYNLYASRMNIDEFYKDNIKNK